MRKSLGEPGLCRGLAVDFAPERHPAAEPFGQPLHVHQVDLRVNGVDAPTWPDLRKCPRCCRRNGRTRTCPSRAGSCSTRDTTGGTTLATSPPKSAFPPARPSRRGTSPRPRRSVPKSQSLSWRNRSASPTGCGCPWFRGRGRPTSFHPAKTVTDRMGERRTRPARTDLSPHSSCSPWQNAKRSSNSTGG